MIPGFSERTDVTSPTQHGPSAPQRQDIQGLRGIAVLLVVLYHAGLPWVPGGYVGVDVFFVISGYLITGLLVREVDQHGRVDYLQFIGRRARRLLPAALVVIAAVVGMSLAVYPPLEREGILSSARAAAVYVSNLWFAGRSVDYLGGDAAGNPLLHMWSLAVEEQFYLVWPWVVAFAAVGPCAVGARARALRVMFAISVISFAACVWMTWVAQPWAFFGTPFRAWEFGCGAIIFLSSEQLRRVPFLALQRAGLLGGVAVLLSATVLSDASLFPGLWALLPVGGTALVLAALTGDVPGRLKSLLSGRLLARVGDVSYSWYLWHWPLLVMAPVLLPDGGAGLKAAALVVSYMVAELSYRFVEEPIRHRAAPRAGVRGVVALAITLTMATVAVLTLMKNKAAGEQLASASQQLIAAARSDLPAVYERRCHVGITGEHAVECIAGVQDSRRVVVLLGDSHAAHWFPAVEQIATKNGWKLVSITKSACPAVNAPVTLETHRRGYRECASWHTDAMRLIADHKPALVLLASSSRYTSVSAGQWEAATRRTIGALTAMDAATVILRDTPWPGKDIPVCLARAEHRGLALATACAFDRAAAMSPGAAFWEAERKAAATSVLARVVDMNPYICLEGRCAAISGEVVLFSDGNHITAGFSKMLASDLEVELQFALGRAP